MTFSLLTGIQLAIQWLPQIESIFQSSGTNETIVQRITDLSPTLANLLTGLGSELFPKAAPALAIVGGIVAGFSPDTTKWLQTSLNTLLGSALNPPLVVDGLYGPKTQAAVTQFQTANGLVVDGLAGTITQGIIDGLLAKLPVLK
jgi:murein L,D-transpeptidase YcbB/YkuD